MEYSWHIGNHSDPSTTARSDIGKLGRDKPPFTPGGSHGSGVWGGWNTGSDHVRVPLKQSGNRETLSISFGVVGSAGQKVEGIQCIGCVGSFAGSTGLQEFSGFCGLLHKGSRSVRTTVLGGVRI